MNDAAAVAARAFPAPSAVERTGIPNADALEVKYGMPMEQIPGHVYVLHFDEPTVVKSVSTDYPTRRDGRGGFESQPLTHYVGWTQRANPRARVYQHGTGVIGGLVLIEPGTIHDEERTKRESSCPKCGQALVPGHG